MNTIRGIVVTLSIGCALFQCIACSSWKRESSTSKVSDRAYTAIVTDNGVGCSVGYSGGVEYTTDGGHTWIAGLNRSVCLFGVEITGKGTTFATGNQRNFVRSEDGGAHWSRMENIGAGQGKSISFCDEQTGWASSSLWAGCTSDAGSSWKALALPSEVKVVETVCCIGQDSGIIAGADGRLFRTDDGGASWLELTSPFARKDDQWQAQFGKTTQGLSLRFSGLQGIAAAIGTFKGTGVLMIRETVDGGKTWSKVQRFPFETVPLSVFTDLQRNVSVFGSDRTVTLFSRK